MLNTEHIGGSIWGTCKQPLFRKQRFYQTMFSIYCSQNNAATEADRRADGRHRDKITSHVSRSGMTRRGNDNEAVGKLIIFKEIKKNRRQWLDECPSAHDPYFPAVWPPQQRCTDAVGDKTHAWWQQFPIKPKFEQFKSCFTGIFTLLLIRTALMAA